MAYATLSQLKAYLKITADADDALLADILERASAYIDTYTGRKFEDPGADATRHFDAICDTAGPWLFLGGDAYSVSEIVNGDGQTLSASDYELVPPDAPPHFAIRIKRSAGKVWTYSDSPESAIAVTARWCYSLTPPADIVHATIRLAATYYKLRVGGPEFYMSPAGIPVLPPAVPGDVADILERYRRLGMAGRMGYNE